MKEQLVGSLCKRHAVISHKCDTPTACKHMVSGSFSLPCKGSFSPFPHGTGSLSISREYLALPDGAGRFTLGFTGPALLRILALTITLHVRDFHPLWLTFPSHSTSFVNYFTSPTTPMRNTHWFGLIRFRSPLLTESLVIFSSYRYLDVSVPCVISYF